MMALSGVSQSVAIQLPCWTPLPQRLMLPTKTSWVFTHIHVVYGTHREKDDYLYWYCIDCRYYDQYTKDSVDRMWWFVALCFLTFYQRLGKLSVSVCTGCCRLIGEVSLRSTEIMWITAFWSSKCLLRRFAILHFTEKLMESLTSTLIICCGVGNYCKGH